MAILINDNYSLQAANKAFDARYLDVIAPWASCAAVITGIPTYRYTGLTVNILGEEYWWKEGVGDGDLVLKSLGGTSNITGATNGLSLVNSGTTIVLGGSLTGDTTIDVSGHTFNVTSGATTFVSVLPVTDSVRIKTAGSSSMCLASDAFYADADGGVLDISGNDFCLGAQTNVAISSKDSSSALSLCGYTFLDTTPTGGTTSDDVLVRNSSFGEVKIISVTDILGGAITSANNGLCSSGQVVSLGGTLTGNTVIDLGGHNLTFDNTGSDFSVTGNTVNSYGHFANYICGKTILSMAADVQVGMGVLCGGSSSCQTSIVFQSIPGGNNYILDEIHSSGISYNTDYSAIGASNPRWIPDAGWTTGYTEAVVTGNSNIIGVCNPTESVYSATTINDFVGISGGSLIYLPTTDVCTGQRISIVDINGDALTNPISVCSENFLILDDTVATINTNYGSITFVFNGIFWSTTAFIN